MGPLGSPQILLSIRCFRTLRIRLSFKRSAGIIFLPPKKITEHFNQTVNERMYDKFFEVSLAPSALIAKYSSKERKSSSVRLLCSSAIGLGEMFVSELMSLIIFL